jgi:hypothetical protein
MDIILFGVSIVFSRTVLTCYCYSHKEHEEHHEHETNHQHESRDRVEMDFVNEFKEKGYVVIPRVLSEEEVQMTRALYHQSLLNKGVRIVIPNILRNNLFFLCS